MNKEIKITPPEGYEIDKENSTFDRIVFKPIGERWIDKMTLLSGYWINKDSQIISSNLLSNDRTNYNLFATEKQAKSALAMARISQIMANDPRFGGVVTYEEWMQRQPYAYYVILRYNNQIETACRYNYEYLAFHTEAQRDLFLKENERLVRDYLMLD